MSKFPNQSHPEGKPHPAQVNDSGGHSLPEIDVHSGHCSPHSSLDSLFSEEMKEEMIWKEV